MTTPHDARLGRNVTGQLRKTTSIHLLGYAIATAVLVRFLVDGMVTKHHARAASGLRHVAGDIAVVTAPMGKRTDLSLPDGSTITLAPGSMVAYPREFAHREVRLEGEAHFRVRPIAERPFFVGLATLRPTSGGTERSFATALDSIGRDTAWSAFSVRVGAIAGERFSSDFVVRAYPEDAYPRVAVREGVVTLAARPIGPGKLGWLSTSGEPVVERADTVVWFSWTTGRLTFTNALRDALPRLMRFYDLDLRVADGSLRDAVLVASLPDTLAEGTLDMIALALTARMEQRGRVITFYRADGK